MGIPQDSTPHQFRQTIFADGQAPKRRKVTAGPTGEALQRQRLHECAKALGLHPQLQDDLWSLALQLDAYTIFCEEGQPSPTFVSYEVCWWLEERYKTCFDELTAFTEKHRVENALWSAIVNAKWRTFVATLMKSVSNVPKVQVLAGAMGQAPPRPTPDQNDSSYLVPIVAYVSPGTTREEIISEFCRQLPEATAGKLSPRITRPTQGRTRQHLRHVELYRLWLDFGQWAPGQPQPPDSPSSRATFVRRLRAGDFDYSRVWDKKPPITSVDELLAGALEWLTPSYVGSTREEMWQEIFDIPF